MASGITTQVSRTTRRERNTTFWTRNGWLSRNGPVTSEMIMETGRAAIQVTTAWRAFVGDLRTFCPGSVNQVSRPVSSSVRGGAIVKFCSIFTHARYVGEACHWSRASRDANL